jgi:hypothetical protein
VSQVMHSFRSDAAAGGKLHAWHLQKTETGCARGLQVTILSLMLHQNPANDGIKQYLQEKAWQLTRLTVGASPWHQSGATRVWKKGAAVTPPDGVCMACR